MINLILQLFIAVVNGYDMIGWFVNGNGCGMTPDTFPFELYTHVLVGQVNVFENGTAWCNTDDLVLKRFVELSATNNIKIMVREGIPATVMFNLTNDNTMDSYRANYLASVGSALNACGVNGGIEFDYEFDTNPTPFGATGYVTDEESTKYTQFMSEVRTALGPGKQVGCDMGVFGFDRISYPLMLKPWVNVSMVNSGKIDYVNLMSYHSNDNTLPWFHTDQTIFPWQSDVFHVTSLWGFNANRINLGIPNYYYNKTHNQPLWCELSSQCPNINPVSSNCQGIRIVSKKQNYNIGKYIKEKGLRGAMPWAANYDSLLHNNTMAKWVRAGFNA